MNLNSSKETVEVTEFEFYKLIVKLPYMHNSYFKLFQNINVDNIVEDLVDDFRTIYLPIISQMNEELKVDYVKFDTDKNIFIINNSYKSRRFFADNLNFEIIKCMHQVLKNCRYI